MKLYLLVTSLSVLVLSLFSGAAMAGRCQDIVPARITFCDDFDQYCVDPPTFPDRCPTESPRDFAAFWAEWPRVGGCGQNQSLSDDTFATGSDPFSATFLGYNLPDASQHVHDLTDDIHAKDPIKNSVNGTDENPLILQYWFDFGTWGKSGNSINYVELMLQGDRAPTDYIVADCPGWYDEAQGPYPVICQQRRHADVKDAHGTGNALCPPLDTTIHSSIAFGSLAYLDIDPCDVGTGRKPSMGVGAIFDGLKWWDLSKDAIAPGNPLVDCKLHSDETNGFNWFTLIIKSSTIEVRIQNFRSEDMHLAGTIPNEYFEATLPRQYLGSFNQIAHGIGQGCLLDSTQHQCLSDDHCFATICMDATNCFNYCDLAVNTEGWWHTFIDTVVLYDGDLLSLEGACCKPDGSCEVADEETCVNTYGGSFDGLFTACGDSLCCPDPFADADHDGDVDQTDFGLWQACFSGDTIAHPDTKECKCFNRDAEDPDVDVDGDDFDAFNACWSGPMVPAITSCDGGL